MQNLSNLSEIDEFNFLDFWTKGGFAFEFDATDKLAALKNHVLYNQKYIRELNGKIPTEVADWDCDWTMRENPPSVFNDVRDTILKSRMIKSYEKVYGDLNFSKQMFHRTPKDYENLYHGHTYDGSHMHIFVYVTDQERVDLDGGFIEVGEVVDRQNVKFNPVDFYTSSPRLHCTHLSLKVRNGLGIVINNINPYFRHQVTKVQTNAGRYTYMLALGYENNCALNKDIKHI